MNKEKFCFYKDHPKTCDPDDFWGQVKRTVNGAPVTQDQIDMIVNAVVTGLKLGAKDTILDLCCGNGALSALLFKQCRGGLGVDFSEYLISVANKHFTGTSHNIYVLDDVVDFCRKPVTPERFTKALCYGSFPYLEHHRAAELLVLIKQNFPHLTHLMIGNCPDKDRIGFFVKGRVFPADGQDDPNSAIGIWRTQDEFSTMAEQCGWYASFSRMPSQFYAAYYRYDVVLTP